VPIEEEEEEEEYVVRIWLPCVISGFRHEVDENCTLLGDYAASSGDLLSTFRDTICPIFRIKNKTKTPEDGTVGLSRNAGKKLPLLAV
jgi:hypothetical protein